MIAKKVTHREKRVPVLGENVIITMMGRFSIIVGTRRVENEVLRSKKGFLLLTYLICRHSEVASLTSLYKLMWPGDESGNPENALKTLISRMRSLLNRFCPGMGDSIINNRGGYSWRCPVNMSIDLYDIRELLKTFRETENDALKEEAVRKLVCLYKSDLLGDYDCDWSREESQRLKEEYIGVLTEYIAKLKQVGDNDEIIKTCRAGLEIDAFNEGFNVGLMDALSSSDRPTEALTQYRHAQSLHCRFRGEQPPVSLQNTYTKLTDATGTIDMSMMKIMCELREHGSSTGSFICEYSVFREVYALQMRNLERFGKGIFLAVIMVSNPDGEPLEPLMQAEVMRGTMDILVHNLRRGDTITQISPTILAMLLPSVDYSTGNTVLERIRSAFFLRYPNSRIVFNYRLSPIGANEQFAGGAPFDD